MLQEKILKAIETLNWKLAEEWFDYMLPRRNWPEQQAIFGDNTPITEIKGADIKELKQCFITDLIRWTEGIRIYQAPLLKFLKHDDDIYKAVLRIFDQNIYKERVRLMHRTKKSWLDGLKIKFNAYRAKEIDHEGIFLELQTVANHLKLLPRKKRGQTKASPALIEEEWFKDPYTQESYRLAFAEQMMYWLTDRPCFMETDYDKELKMPKYDTLQRGLDWWYRGVIKIFDNIRHALQEENIPADVIARRLEKVFHIPMVISLIGMTGSRRSIEAYRAMRRQEMKMIRKIEGMRDLGRDLRIMDERAQKEAFTQLNKVEKYVEKHDWKVCWIYMLRHPESPLWYLLGATEPEVFEYHFLTIRTMNLAPSQLIRSRMPESAYKKEVEKFKKDIEEAIIRHETAELREKGVAYARISNILDRNSKGCKFEFFNVKDEQLLMNLHYKEQQFRQVEVIKEIGEGIETVADADIDWKNKVLRSAQYFHYLKGQEKILAKEVDKQRKGKEFADKSKDPSIIAVEGFVKDGSDKEKGGMK